MLATPSGFHFDEPTHRYTLNGTRLWSVTEILRDIGYIDATWFTDAARERGKAVHMACHFLDEGDLDWKSLEPIEEALGESIIARVKAYEKFKAETGFEPDPNWIERPGYHPIYLYAGTCDRKGRFPDGRRAIVDLKTGPIEDWVELQLGGYDEMIPAEDKPRHLLGLELRADGDYSTKPFTNVNAGRIFLSVQTAHRWGKEHGKFAEPDPILGG